MVPDGKREIHSLDKKIDCGFRTAHVDNASQLPFARSLVAGHFFDELVRLLVCRASFESRARVVQKSKRTAAHPD
jgi:hypothetical protein